MGVPFLVVNTTALKSLAWEKGWSIPELAKRLGIDYSYLFRVINGEKKGGGKLFAGLYRLCREENLDFNNYIFFSDSVDNRQY
jgi:transcriptional regulator with XRE-family HTH domain